MRLLPCCSLHCRCLLNFAFSLFCLVAVIFTTTQSRARCRRKLRDSRRSSECAFVFRICLLLTLHIFSHSCIVCRFVHVNRLTGELPSSWDNLVNLTDMCDPELIHSIHLITSNLSLMQPNVHQLADWPHSEGNGETQLVDSAPSGAKPIHRKYSCGVLWIDQFGSLVRPDGFL